MLQKRGGGGGDGRESKDVLDVGTILNVRL
jgi:hypothetical protein